MSWNSSPKRIFYTYLLCFTRGEGAGPGPKRAAFQQAVWTMTRLPNMWKLLGSWFVPDPSPVCDKSKWFSFGTLLALALLTNNSVYPVSPILIYVLLVGVHKPVDFFTAMRLSLNYIKEVDELQAAVILPWMIIQPRQDWRELPGIHNTKVFYMLSGLEIDVSSRPTNLY